jgi:excisionase family DNA binding protein
MPHDPAAEPRPAHDNAESATAPPDIELGSILAAAAYAQCSRTTIRRMIQEGELPAYRFGDRLVRVDMNAVRSMFRRINP